MLYSTWQPAWDTGSYDRNHVMIGTVASYDNARLVLAQGPEKTVKIDLKEGTVIKPEGLKLAPGEKVAVLGYYSKGTFIADRVVLHDAR